MSDLKIFAQTIEEETINQINLLASQKAFSSAKIRIMPDCHAGKGCVVGFTADLGEKIIPNIVGVDIGCGMLVTQIDDSHPDLEKLDSVIKDVIPSGMTVHDSIVKEYSLENVLCYQKLNDSKKWIDRSLGSLGGGNHFIELDKGQDGTIYLVIHTGSRNLGKQIAELYQEEAQYDCSLNDERNEKIKQAISLLKSEGQQRRIKSAIKKIEESYQDKRSVPLELSYLTNQHRLDYLHDMRIAQDWAKVNRRLIAQLILEKMGWHSVDQFESVHNYIDENNVVRKGAISALKGEKVIIPLNMKDGTILGVGKGNKDWNYSAPHGAGRLLSRSQARKLLSVNEFTSSMKGIYTTTATIDTLDEAPKAYKNSKEILEMIKPTVDVTSVIKPIYNFKATN